MSKSSSLNSLNHMHESSEDSLLDWLSAYKQYILLGIIALLGIIVVSYRFISASTLRAEGNFIQAQADFSRFQNSNGGSSASQVAENLSKLSAILIAYPEIQAKYDASIAQTLIIDQDPAQANFFAERTFKRVKNEPIKLYNQYARTSLLITDAQYEQALAETERLQKSLEAASPEEIGATLTTSNLIRLAFLYQQLGKKEEETQAWNRLLALQSVPEAMAVIQQLFNEGNISLSNYIDARNLEVK